MANGILINWNEVRATATTIRGLNEKLALNLQDIKTQMNNMNSSWESDASNTIIANFNALAPKFDNYREVVDSYSKFLDTTATSYQDTDQAINNNANAFK